MTGGVAHGAEGKGMGVEYGWKQEKNMSEEEEGEDIKDIKDTRNGEQIEAPPPPPLPLLVHPPPPFFSRHAPRARRLV